MPSPNSWRPPDEGEFILIAAGLAAESAVQREAALWRLWVFGYLSPELQALLSTCLNDPDPSVRVTAAHVVLDLPVQPDLLVAACMLLLSSGEQAGLDDAISVLESLPIDFYPVADALHAALLHPDALVRHRASRALSLHEDRAASAKPETSVESARASRGALREGLPQLVVLPAPDEGPPPPAASGDDPGESALSRAWLSMQAFLRSSGTQELRRSLLHDLVGDDPAKVDEAARTLNYLARISERPFLEVASSLSSAEASISSLTSGCLRRFVADLSWELTGPLVYFGGMISPAALQLLLTIRPPTRETRAGLHSLLDHSSQFVSIPAARALVILEPFDREGTRHLLRALSLPRAKLRTAALASLRALRTGSLSPAFELDDVLLSLSSFDPEVRAFAVAALPIVRDPPPDWDQYLVPLLRDGDPGVREAARAAIEACQNRPSPSPVGRED